MIDVPHELGEALRRISIAKVVPGYRLRDGSVIGWAVSSNPSDREAEAPPVEILNALDSRGWIDVTPYGPISLSDAGKAALALHKANSTT